MIIGQITDFHVTTPGGEADRRYRTAEHLEAAVAHLNALAVRPDVVVATGDLVDGGTVEEYQRLRRLLEPLTMPVYLIPGNHDDRANLRTVFSDHSYLPREGPFLHYAVEDHPLRLLALDTVVPGEIGGALCEARLAWIEARLTAAPPRPTFVFMHHPPFRTGVGWSDGAAGLGGADPFGETVSRHPEIERIVCGHVHRPIQAHWRGTVASTAPATAHQLVLALGPASKIAAVMEPPACQLHLWAARRGRGQPHQLHWRVRDALRRLNPTGSCGSHWGAPRPPRRAFWSR